MKKLNTRQIALNGVVAGLYAAITILTASFAYGDIQFRIADALCLLVALEPSLTVGLTLGCVIANIFSTVSVLDIVVGSAATLIGCLLTARMKKRGCCRSRRCLQTPLWSARCFPSSIRRKRSGRALR